MSIALDFVFCCALVPWKLDQTTNPKDDMDLAIQEPQFQGIGQFLVYEKLLEKAEALDYSKLAASENISLLQYVVKHHILQAEDIAKTLSNKFGLPFLDLDSIAFETLPLNLIDESLIRKHRILVLSKCKDTLLIALDDPSKQRGLKEIQFYTGLFPEVVLVETNKLHVLIDQILNTNQQNAYKTTISNRESDSPTIQYINQLLQNAMDEGVSDIHFEPYDKTFRIRYRQDGLLCEIENPPTHLALQIASRIKIMANLDITEKRLPQDGSFKIQGVKGHSIDFRVSTCPTIGGEKIVVRILDPNSAKLGIEALGLNYLQQSQLMQAIKKPQGMILVTGPTGSGKTMTLYTALNILNTMEVNISTAEDPVEIKIQGINQATINPKAGLDFAGLLRSFLRQDPDIIMVGEIRDFETADLAVKAAQTGHLVLSSLHTNSAVETINRLMHMGVAPFNLASSLGLIIAQRLARRLCDHCKVQRFDLNQSHLIQQGFNEVDINTIKLYKAESCEHCMQGYKGRIGLFEMLPMSKAIMEIILSQGNAQELLQTAQHEGMITMYQSGLEKVKLGLTTLEEINRVTVAGFL